MWPETKVNSSAVFKCLENSAVELTRECKVGGQWGKYDPEGCGVLAKNFTYLVLESKNVL